MTRQLDGTEKRRDQTWHKVASKPLTARDEEQEASMGCQQLTACEHEMGGGEEGDGRST